MRAMSDPHHGSSASGRAIAICATALALGGCEGTIGGAAIGDDSRLSTDATTSVGNGDAEASDGRGADGEVPFVPDSGAVAGDDSGFVVPDTGVDAGFIIPDLGFVVPDAGFVAVDVGLDAGVTVDTGFVAPDTGIDAGFIVPDTGADVGFIIPDLGFAVPDTGVDAGFIVPDMGFVSPDTGVDVGFVVPDTGVDAGFVVPDSGVDGGVAVDAGTSPAAPGSIRFVVNAARAYDYGVQLVLPPTFGTGEFTFEVWIRPDNSFPIGSTASGAAQRNNWNNDDFQPYSRADWWYPGNFLLDGHNNFGFSRGTFSLQFYGGGRVRWLFGDGVVPVAGGLWSAQAHPASNAPSLLDGAWHHVVCVRRWRGSNASQLELWIDGAQIDVENINARVDMRTFWNTWPGFGGNQAGWFWGVEKQAAVGILSQYEDYKGLVAELRYWSIARAAADLSGTAHRRAVTRSSSGLVGWFRFDEGQGSRTCDTLDRTRCMPLTNPAPNVWSVDAPPLTP